MATNIGEISLVASIDASAYDSGAKRIEAANSKMAESTGGMSKRFAAGWGIVSGIASNVAGRALDAVQDAVGDTVKRVDTMNNFPKIMKNFGFSAADSAKQVKRMSDRLTGLPTSLDAITGSVQKIAPMSKSLAAATDTSLALNDALLAGGKSMGMQSDALEQYTQMLSVGKVDMQAWRSVVNAMPGQMNMLAVSLLGANHNQMDLYNAMKDGTVTFGQLNDAMVNLDKNGANGFASFAQQAKDATGGISTQATNMRTALVRGLANVFQVIQPQLVSGMQLATQTINKSFTWVTGAFTGLVSFIQSGDVVGAFSKAFNVQPNSAMADILKGMRDGIADFISVVAKDLPTALSSIKDFSGKAVNYLAGMVKWAADNRDWLLPMITGMGVFVGQLKLMYAVSAAGGMVNLAKDVLTGGAAFKSLLGVFNMVRDGWAGLTLVFEANPWGLLIAGIAAVVAGLVWFFSQTDTGKRIWSGFVNWLTGVWQGVSSFFSGLWSGIVNVFNAAASGVTAVWQVAVGVLTGVWNGLVTAAKFAFVLIGTVILTPIQIAVNALAAVFNWLNTNVVQPVWNAISAAVSAAWNWINASVFGPMMAGIHAVGDVFNWLNVNVVQPVWNGIRTAFGTAWNWIKTVVIDAWNREIRGWGIVFNFLLHGVVEPVWNGIRGAFGAAWNWIENSVINPFKRGVNALGNAFTGMKDMAAKAFDSLKNAAATPVRWIVNVVYTNGIQKVWNGLANAVGLNLKLPDSHFATGGIMPGYTPGRDNQLIAVGGGESIMRPEWTRAVGSDYVNTMNAAARSGGIGGVRNVLGYSVGGVVGGAWDSIKRGASGLWNGTKKVAGNVWDGVKKVASGVADFISDPVGTIRRMIEGPVKGMLNGIGSGQWGSILAQLPVKVIGGLIDKAKDLVSKMGAGDYKAGAGVAQWTPQVLQALSMLGQPAGLLNTVLRRMNQESGGNPHARNDWDSNAKAGMPSQGLMQTIPSTFAAYAGPFVGRGILDPLANIYAGLNYALHRYGSLDALNRPGGYASGGIVPMLASGGRIVGRGHAIVGEDGPEFLDLPVGATVTPLRTGKSGDNGGDVYVTINGANDPMGDVQEINRQLAFKKA